MVLNNEELLYFQVGKQLKRDLACVTVFIFSHSLRSRVPLSLVFQEAEFFIMSNLSAFTPQLQHADISQTQCFYIILVAPWAVFYVSVWFQRVVPFVFEHMFLF